MSRFRGSPQNPIARTQIRMAYLALSNRSILAGLAAAKGATATSALASVKLARLRKALASAAAPIAEAFDEIGKQHATKGDAGQPLVMTNDANEPLTWIATGTPCYLLDDEAAFGAAVAPLYDELTPIEAPTLTASDLDAIRLTQDVGDALEAIRLEQNAWDALEPFCEAF